MYSGIFRLYEVRPSSTERRERVPLALRLLDWGVAGVGEMVVISQPPPPKIVINLYGGTSEPTGRSNVIRCKKLGKDEALREEKSGFVDYDKGERRVWTRVTGFRKNDIPRRHRLCVERDRFQKDWTVSDVAERIMELNHWESVDELLNCWIGRFARKNFPLLIKVNGSDYCLSWYEFHLISYLGSSWQVFLLCHLWLQELTQRGSIEHCVKVFQWMKIQKNYCARTDIYNMMIRLHARHNRTDQARGLFFEMQEWR